MVLGIILVPESKTLRVMKGHTMATTLRVRLRGVNREAQFEISIPRGRKGTILSLTRDVHVGK